MIGINRSYSIFYSRSEVFKMKQDKWTIMVYMAGDNNLAVDMAYAMEQIREIAGRKGNNLNLYVYYDGNSPSIPTLYCDFSDKNQPKYVSSQNVPNKLYPVRSKINENAADQRSVLNFVDWCVNKVGGKADRYALIFSGHSLGFQDIGLFKDEGTGKTMKMTNLFELLQMIALTKGQLEEMAFDKMTNREKDEFLENDSFLDTDKQDRYERKTTEIIGQKLDLLGFDSCVMGMIEVGYEFDTVAKTMVVSEGSVPSAGWTYAKILGGLARGEHCNHSAQDVAMHFVKDFIRSQDKFTVGGVSVDMAAWDMSEMRDLTEKFNNLAESLINCFEDKHKPIYKFMERAILQAHWKCQSYMYDQNVDLGDFCELLHEECQFIKDSLSANDVKMLDEIQAKCRDVLEQLKKAVILSGFSGGGYQYSNGVSVFFPWSWEGYQVSQKDYENLEFTMAAKSGNKICWADFLKKYLFEVARRESAPPTPVGTSPGSKYRYRSGVKFDENLDSLLLGVAADNDAIDLDTLQNIKLAGQQHSKLAGQQQSKLAGQNESKLAGQQESKLAGQQHSKLAGQQESKLAGQQQSKLAGQQHSKLAGQQQSKLAGQQQSKLAGQQQSKLAGQQESKLAGQQHSKLAGQHSSKLAGGGDGGSAFFDNLKLFKNIESRWNISGFTKRPDEEDDSLNYEKGLAESA